jgi:hypothetical protein
MLLLKKGIMNDDVRQTAMATWASKDLPARLDAVATAKLLGFAVHDIQILMAVGKLTPLGDPAPNAPKWFAAVEIIRLATDQDWLHKATKEIAKYWRHKRERVHESPPSSRTGKEESNKLRSKLIPTAQSQDGANKWPMVDRI